MSNILDKEEECVKRVLSIQSHVVYGYVGNKAAVFPLQVLGFNVDVINSVHFSNHTGHLEGVEGDVLEGSQLLSILKGLERNNLLDDICYLLTGYIGSESFLLAVLDVIKKLRSKNSNVKYVCDPVLGDNGHFYVPECLVQIYIEKVIPLSDIVTPNQFEIEQLTGIKIKSIKDARKACSFLHGIGPTLVCLTSCMNLNDDLIGENAEKSNIAILASQRSKESTQDEFWRIDCSCIDGRYTGTGDLCTALLLAWTTEHPENLGLVLEKVVGTMYAVIERTHKNSGNTVASKELRLIESKKDIECPPIIFRAQRLL